jgi:hypothetical protein
VTSLFHGLILPMGGRTREETSRVDVWCAVNRKNMLNESIALICANDVLKKEELWRDIQKIHFESHTLHTVRMVPSTIASHHRVPCQWETARDVTIPYLQYGTISIRQLCIMESIHYS